MHKKKVILLILDGWGYRADSEHNAVSLSSPVNFNRMLANDPNLLIDASEEYVGLPAGQMGNSEVGHTNIGAGRIVYQDLLKISRSFESGEAAKNTAFLEFLKNTAGKSGRVHLLGLISDGGVHSHIEHFKSVITLAKKSGIQNIYVHAFTDGRDTPPQSGFGYLTNLEEWMKENNAGTIADISGRYYAMDRDKRWDRVQKAYEMLRFRKGDSASSVKEAVQSSYKNNITDEFILPVILNGADGAIKDGDGVFFMNFRADRVREMLSVFYKDDFDGFDRGEKPDLELLTLTEYDESMQVPVMYPSDALTRILGEEISNAGLKQLRIAETEKYAHVTYFFNGGSETPFENEERVLVPSPRDVPTYDLKPEMSVRAVAARFEEEFSKGCIDFAVMNFANPDMVGHTGVENAAIAACKAVDEMLGKIIEIADKTGAVLLVTADHGNSEQMWDYANNQPHTSHTLNPVHLVIHNYPCELTAKRGKLADIAPTILKIFGFRQPEEMTGVCLIK
ncbi:MAG: 2,3-bisphosphoglycerate-independent phosphoglycerate mutase [Deferribacteraceae bacterium]|jgi:2,3-bisphosphoglycerate-independent phosphoglycerate mutase|nr:2,3-bisphosphoglycerate-independent phosphoglycerate mutase [Deferribacteraceae bacterium]